MADDTVIDDRTSKTANVTLEEGDKVASLRTLPDEKAAKRIWESWEAQDKVLQRRMQQWRANELRRQGYTQVSVVKDRDTKRWAVWAPPGEMPIASSVNKLDRLCRRLRAIMFSDPPMPEPTPDQDDDKARDAAEFAGVVLRLEDGEGHLDGALKAADAFDAASSYDSGFVWYYVDPQAGGQRKMAVQAHPMAQFLADATVNPQTGAPWPAQELVTRYVLPDKQTLTDDPKQAGTIWVPRLASEVIDSRNVRFIPAVARDIWDADGVILATLVPLGRLKSRFEKVRAMSEDDLKQLVSDLPDVAKDIIPPLYRKSDLEKGEPTDDAPVFTLTLYMKQDATLYPKGCYAVVAGSSDHPVLVDRQDWAHPTDPEATLDIPVTQFKQMNRGRDPYGQGVAEGLGGGNEIRAAMIGTMLEHLARFLNRKVFYPHTSTFQPKSAQAMTGTYIPINPGGAPTVEQVPDFPVAAEKMLATVSAEMDDDIGLAPVAQGINPPGVQSGLHAQQLIEQVYLGLSDVKQNTERGLTRGWRIMLQLIKAFYTVPQQLGYVSDDISYRQRQWTGADLGSTKDVRIAKGSFTMLAPSAKLAVAEHLFTLQTIDAEDLRRMAVGSVSGVAALQDDPARTRIQRQIDSWAKGPANPQDPNVPQEAAALWAPAPGDDDPTVAAIRYRELRRLTQSTRYSRWPEPWKQPVTAEFTRMQAAAGVQTVAAQQQAQQAAAQAQAQAVAQADAQKTAAATALEATKHQSKVEEIVTQAGAQAASRPPQAPPAPPFPARGGVPAGV